MIDSMSPRRGGSFSEEAYSPVQPPQAPCRPTEPIEWLIGIFAADSPGHSDPVMLLGSTPVECGRSVETVRHSELADVCGYAASTSSGSPELDPRRGAREPSSQCVVLWGRDR